MTTSSYNNKPDIINGNPDRERCEMLVSACEVTSEFSRGPTEDGCNVTNSRPLGDGHRARTKTWKGEQGVLRREREEMRQPDNTEGEISLQVASESQSERKKKRKLEGQSGP